MDSFPLLTGIGYGLDGIQLELRAPGGDKFEAPVGETLALRLHGPRRCIGYRAPGSERLVPCPEAHINARGAQCERCIERAQIIPCLRCDGARCQNPPRRGFCVAPDNHAVYLAAYGPGVVKVGVARWHRRALRIAEQGARCGLIIARDDGQQVRRVETLISRFGTPDRLAIGERLTTLTLPADIPALMAELEHVADGLMRRIPGVRWLTPGEPIEVAPFPVLDHAPRLIRPAAGEHVGGTVITSSGQVIVLRRGGDLIAIDLGGLVGMSLERVADPEAGEYQMALVA